MVKKSQYKSINAENNNEYQSLIRDHVLSSNLTIQFSIRWIVNPLSWPFSATLLFWRRANLLWVFSSMHSGSISSPDCHYTLLLVENTLDTTRGPELSGQIYRRGAPSALALCDVRRAGRHPPAVGAAVMGLVGAQGEGAGRGWTGAEGRVWRGGRHQMESDLNVFSQTTQFKLMLIPFVCLVFLDFQLTSIFAIAEDTGSTAAPGEERQRRCHQPVNYAAFQWTQCKATGCREEGQKKILNPCAFFDWAWRTCLECIS